MPIPDVMQGERTGRPAWYRALLRTASDAVLVVERCDADVDRVIDANAAAHACLGPGVGTLVGCRVRELCDTVDGLDELLSLLDEQACAEGDVRIVDAEGQPRVVAATATLLTEEDEGTALLVCRTARMADEADASQARLAAIVASSDDAIIAKTLDGIITNWNASAERLFQYSKQEAIGRHISLIVPDDRREELDEIMATLRAGRRVESLETVRIRKDGTRLDVSITVSPIFDRHGHIVGASAIDRDITARRKTERFNQFLIKARGVLNDTLDAALTLDRVTHLMVPEIAEWCVIDVLRDGAVQMQSIAHTDPEKVAIIRRMREQYPIDLDAGRGVAAAMRTQRPQLYAHITDALMEEASRDNGQYTFLRELGLRSAVAIPLIARGRTIGGLTLVTTERQHPFTEDDFTYIQEIGHSCAVALDNAWLYGKAQREIEERQRAEEQVRALNQKLRLRLDELEAVLDVAPVGLAVAHDPSCEEITVNPALAEMLGIDPDDNASKSRTDQQHLPFRVLSDGAEVPAGALPMQRSATMGEVVSEEEYEIRRDDGERRDLLEYAVPLFDEAKAVRGSVGAFVDVTNLKAVEHDLRRRSEILATLSEINKQLAAELNLEKLVKMVTDAGTELCGADYGAFFYNLHDVEGGTHLLHHDAGGVADVFERLPVERKAALFAPTFQGRRTVRYDDVTQVDRPEEDNPFVDMDAGQAPVRSYLAVPVVSREGEVLGGLLFGCAEAGRFSEEHERIVERVADQAAIAIENGRLYASLEHELSERRYAEMKLQDLNETLEQRVAERTEQLARVNDQLQEEVAERRRAEAALAETNAALMHSNRELQEFAYVASHDLQAPLRKIHAFTELLQEEHAAVLDAAGIELLDRMRKSVLQMSGLIRDLLAFSRVKTKGKPLERTDLHAVVEEVLSDLQVHDADTASVEVATLPAINADPTQMRQLFQNLIDNALKFHEPGQHPRIRVWSKPRKRGDVVEIFVQDRGIGMEKEFLDRIFLPFQRLNGRNQYEGSGIGLAICRRIVERHRGTIRAESVPGEGSTFIVTLPAHLAMMDDAAPHDATPTAQ